MMVNAFERRRGLAGHCCGWEAVGSWGEVGDTDDFGRNNPPPGPLPSGRGILTIGGLRLEA